MFLDLHRPVLSVGQVAGTLIDLQGALTWAFTLILLHSEEEKTEELILKAVLRQFLEIFLIKKKKLQRIFKKCAKNVRNSDFTQATFD